MPTGILKFKLPEEDVEFAYAQNAHKLAGIIHDYGEWLRTQYKYLNRDTIPCEELREKFWGFVREAGLPDEIEL